jgi:hypothetical protein
MEKRLINEWHCPKGHVTVSTNRDEGVVPKSIVCPTCVASGDAPQVAASQNYQVEQAQIPSIEFYLPTPAELKKYEKDTIRKNNMSKAARRTFKVLMLPLHEGNIMLYRPI